MIGARAQRRSEGNVVGGLEQILVTVARPNPVVVLWRWRYEAALLAATVVSVALLVRGAGAVGATALTAAVALSVGIALTLSPALRRLARARAWCIITPHRVRTGCAQARIHSRQGRLPFVVLTTAMPHGERVLLWCRAGTSIEDFIAARPLLTAACWAMDITVTPTRRHAQLILLNVHRGEPAETGQQGLSRPRSVSATPPPDEYPPSRVERPADQPSHRVEPAGDTQPGLPRIPKPRQPAE